MDLRRHRGLRAAVVLATASTGLALTLPAGTASAATGRGHVYVLSNDAARNTVLVFTRDADGHLSPAGQVATTGRGTGAGLGSQGSLALARHGSVLLAVNPGSDSLTAFRVDGDRLRSPDAVPTGGEPISVTSSGDVAYTVNGRSLDISGAEVDRGGDLQPLRGSTQELNPFAAAPAEIAFTPGGRRLVVTEKGSNSIDVFGVTGRGRATAPVTSRAVGSTPFGFDVDRQGRVFVSNAGGPPNSTSYRVRPDRKLQPLTPPAASGQGAACWLVLTPDGGYAFTANTGSGTVSSYAVNPDGSLRLLQAVAARTAGAPADESVTQDGRDLYVRVSFSAAGGNPARTEIQGFSIGSGGTLTALGASVAVPVSSAGVLAD